jgi:hypothetical protein
LFKRFFYENVINVNNVSDLLVDEKTHTYSMKNIADLVIDRIIPDNHPNVFQLSFSIYNLKYGSNFEARITETQINQIKIRYIMKGINIRGFLSECHDIKKKKYSLYQWEVSGPNGKKEVEKYFNYFPIYFKENSIITIRYNPQKATVEYWCGNNKVNFLSEIYDFRPYFSKIFIKFYNCSIRFICIINVLQSEDLNKLIPLKVFQIENKTVKLDINNYNNPLGFKTIDSS